MTSIHRIAKTSPDLLQGKVCLVTGAGSPLGIGRCIVTALVAAGAKAVYACDLNTGNFESLKRKCKEINSNCAVHAVVFDVTSEDRTLEVVKQVVEEEERLDIYFANAGYANNKPLSEVTTKDYELAMDVMTRSVFYAIKHASRAMMVTSPTKQAGGGAIVVTSSVAAYLGSFSDLVYASAKSALDGMIGSASVQLSASDIRINGVAPGAVVTSIMSSHIASNHGESFHLTLSEEEVERNYRNYMAGVGAVGDSRYYYNRVPGPQEIADVAVFLGSDLSSAINGQVVKADSGKSAGALGETHIGPVARVKPL